MNYIVMLSENSGHTGDDPDMRERSRHDSLEAAEAACRAAIDEFLRSQLRHGMSADELLRIWRGFGVNAFVRTPERSRDWGFSGEDYATERCAELCASPPEPDFGAI